MPMNDDLRQLDAIEDALLELDQAERARVFDRTRVEPRQLLKVDPVKRLGAARRRVLRWVPVAAAIGMVAVVWAVMFDTPSKHARPGAGVVVTTGVVPADDGCARIVDCRTGPTKVALADSCLAYDYDGDSDVDMVDWSIYDLSSKRRRQAHP